VVANVADDLKKAAAAVAGRVVRATVRDGLCTPTSPKVARVEMVRLGAVRAMVRALHATTALG